MGGGTARPARQYVKDLSDPTFTGIGSAKLNRQQQHQQQQTIMKDKSAKTKRAKSAKWKKKRLNTNLLNSLSPNQPNSALASGEVADNDRATVISRTPSISTQVVQYTGTTKKLGRGRKFVRLRKFQQLGNTRRG
ncbi:hypothetical protein DAPPUDRAFT_116176 [Daphnia pulex]|uniref:Uncharacterized protein n=1 Tax=Daphnia pulex TaxID=6669 RepID=E9HNU2_DAPPU|nr:hypothetical protein DAPPUDRAFT_116176 [Daphnia pulex]|eukprot:EFX66591.1 hypothetical protein DAPPUDRAFT_116176 [Daphnia pulex]